MAPSAAAFSMAARACAMLRFLSAVAESWHSATLNCVHRRKLATRSVRSKPRAASGFRIQNRGNPGVTLDSGGVGGSRAGGERASSGRKELGAAAMAATRRSGRREGEEMRARLAQSFRRGARSAAAVDVATALISSWEMPWRCRECGR